MGEKYIRLGRMERSRDRVDYYFAACPEVEKYFSQECHLFAQYEADISEVPESILMIPFLGNVMQIAWLTDSVVEVPCVDKAFSESLLRIREAYRKMYPKCPLGGELKAERIVDNSAWECERSAQLYTGGLDATTTYVRHRDEKPLLLLTYGKYDDKKFSGDHYAEDVESERNFQSDRLATTAFAKREGTEATFVRSNYVTFFKMRSVDKDYGKLLGDGCWHGIQHAMAILSITVPAAYLKRVKVIYIASSNNPKRQVACASDPTTDNEFCFAGTHASHDGYELTDEEKAAVVCRYQREIQRPLELRVCSWNDHNCCQCEKCVRRMLQLHAEGGDPKQFGFPLENTLYQQTKRFLWHEVQFMTDLNIVTWRTTIQRMRDNYENVYDKAVADFLFTYDFEKEKKRGLYRYYRTNFFSILKRKIKRLFTRGD